MDAALLDTDILSEVLKQRNAPVAAKAASYLSIHGQFCFSVFTRFEIERGYKEKNAVRLLSRLATFCQNSLVFPLSDVIFERAADLWVIAGREVIRTVTPTSSSPLLPWKAGVCW